MHPPLTHNNTFTLRGLGVSRRVAQSRFERSGVSKLCQESTGSMSWIHRQTLIATPSQIGRNGWRARDAPSARRGRRRSERIQGRTALGPSYGVWRDTDDPDNLAPTKHLLMSGESREIVSFVHAQNILELAEKVRAWAVTKREIKRLWFFGSRVKGSHRPKSDLDIAIELMPEVLGIDNGRYAWLSCGERFWGSELDQLTGDGSVAISFRSAVHCRWRRRSQHPSLRARLGRRERAREGN